MAEIDLFEPRRLLTVVRQTEFRARSYLRDTFFPSVRTFDTKSIDIDVETKGQRKVASFVSPQLRGTFVERRGYKTQTFTPAYIAPYMVTTAEQILDRMPGEALYNPVTPEARAAEILARDLAELDRRITRREELMAREAIFEGQITITGEGLGEGKKITFWDPEDRPYTEVATSWTESTANPLDDLRTICRDITRKTGRTPSVMLCGIKAANALMAHLQKQESAINQRRVMLGQINPMAMADGVTFIGDLSYPALQVMTYDEWYFDDETETDLPMVPEDCVLIVCRGAPTTRAYASVVLTDPVRGFYSVVGDRAANSWISMDNPRGRILQLTCAPLMVVHEPQCFHVIKVVDD